MSMFYNEGILLSNAVHKVLFQGGNYESDLCNWNQNTEALIKFYAKFNFESKDLASSPKAEKHGSVKLGKMGH